MMCGVMNANAQDSIERSLNAINGRTSPAKSRALRFAFVSRGGDFRAGVGENCRSLIARVSRGSVATQEDGFGARPCFVLSCTKGQRSRGP